MTDPKDKPVEVVFAPGCFDDFDGTPEELAELVAAIHQMAADGTIMENSEPVSDDEAEEILSAAVQRIKGRQ